MAFAGSSGARAHHARSPSAPLAVIPAERFALLSQPASLATSAASPPVIPRAGGAIRRAESASDSTSLPSSPAEAAARGTFPAVTATGACAAQTGRTTDPLSPPATADGTCAVGQTGDHGGAASAPTRADSNPPASHGLSPQQRQSSFEAPQSAPASSGLSLEQLRHLVALTNANDGPRDMASAFPYASSCDGRPGRSRLSINAAQRRLDSWNRAREPVVENSAEHIRAQRRLKRSGSAPPLLLRSAAGESAGELADESAGGLAGEPARGGDSSDCLRRPAQPMESVVSEARKVALRRWLRRSRSAHVLGGRDTEALWSEAMTALIWGRGGAVVYRRPAGRSLQAPSPPSGADLKSSGGAQLASDITRRSAAGSAAGSPAGSAAGSAAGNAVGNGRMVALGGRYDRYMQIAPAAAAAAAAAAGGHVRAGDPRVYPSERFWRTQTPGVVSEQSRAEQSRIQQQHQLQLQQQRQRQWQQHQRRQQLWQQQQREVARDPVTSVFAWAAEQRMAARRAERTQP